MKFIQVAVLDKEDYKLYTASADDDCLTSWVWLTCSDDLSFALYNCDEQCVIIREDEYCCCSNAFLRGLRYGGTEVNVTYGYVVVEDKYSWKQVCEKLDNNEYVVAE
jgi:hypothetical protein